MKAGIVLFGLMICIFVLVAVFVPLIFGNMEGGANISTQAQKTAYNATTTVIQTSEVAIYGIAAVIGLFILISALFVFRKRR